MSALDFDPKQEYSADPRARAAEVLREEVALALREAMQRAGMKQKDLAARLDCAQSRISIALGVDRNITLRNAAEVAWAAGFRFKLDLLPFEE